MPNWCYNSGKIKGSMEELNTIKEFSSFEDIYPSPAHIEGVEHSEWCRANWGVIWDVNENELFDASDVANGILWFDFKTAWSPPLMLFAHLSRRFPSLEIKCFYDEESSEYTGISTFTRDDHSDYCFYDYYHKTDRSYDEVLERIGTDHPLASDLKEIIDKKREDRDEDHLEEWNDDELYDSDIDFLQIHETLIEFMTFQYEQVRVEFRPAEFGGVLFPKKYVLKIKRFPELPEDWECGICREGQDERPVLKLRCGGDHIFHSICAKEWGKTKLKRREQTTCPMCARVVSSSGSQEPESQQTPIAMDIE